MRSAQGQGEMESVNDRWRTWLMTGVRRGAIDRRRVRGAHKGIKKMLVEGMNVSSEKPYTWKDFSDAMVRQSVGDAMRTMPRDDAELVKLAYFGGLTNRDLADRLRLTEAMVERRLRSAIQLISEHVRRGRGMGRTAFAVVAAWLSARWIGDALGHVAPAAVVAAAAVIIAGHPVATSGPAHTHHVWAPAVGGGAANTVVPPMPAPAAGPSQASPVQLPPPVEAPPPLARTAMPLLPPLGVPQVTVPPITVPQVKPAAPPSTVTTVSENVKSGL